MMTDTESTLTEEFNSKLSVTPERLLQLRYLSLQGGSVKGIAYVGALQALETIGFDLSSLKGVAGTSAGAIAAALVALGCPLAKIEEIIGSLDIKTFLDEETLGVTRDTFLTLKDKGSVGRAGYFASHPSKTSLASSSAASRLSQAYGIYRGEYFREWLEQTIQEQINTITDQQIQYLTFGELHELTRAYPVLADLFVVGANIDTQEAVTFSYLTHPNVVIADAVRISMSIPLLFYPHQVHEKVEDALEEVHRQVVSEHLYVDGGIILNYPLKVFDFDCFLPDSEVSYVDRHPCMNPYSLGLRLVSSERKDYLEGQTQAPTNHPSAFMPFFKGLLATIYHKQESDHMQALESQRTLYIDTFGIGMLDFDLDDETKEALKDSGRRTVEAYARTLGIEMAEASDNQCPYRQRI